MQHYPNFLTCFLQCWLQYLNYVAIFQHNIFGENSIVTLHKWTNVQQVPKLLSLLPLEIVFQRRSGSSPQGEFKRCKGTGTLELILLGLSGISENPFRHLRSTLTSLPSLFQEILSLCYQRSMLTNLSWSILQ